MQPYGYNIVNVLITDLEPERSVVDAMNAINAARRNREASVEKAEADKVLAIKAAEADAEAKYLSGAGIAKMRTAITQGFKNSIDDMSECGMNVKDTVHLMLVTQYVALLLLLLRPRVLAAASTLLLRASRHYIVPLVLLLR
jgi:hypothetical protein